MSNKLLHKTQRFYLVFSLAIFIIVAPLFYFITEKLYIANTDETLMLYKKEFLDHAVQKLKISDIPVWNKFNNSIKIEGTKGLKKDTLFSAFYFVGGKQENKEFGEFNGEQQEQEKEAYRELNSPIHVEGKPYTLVAKINLVESNDLMMNIALLFLILIILMLVGLFFITRKLSTNLWKPFYETLETIELFEIDKNKPLQFSTTNIEEFSRLNKSIGKLIKKNITIFENQREFVENAAHELQTPIAIFQAKIDTLIQRSDVTAGQSEILGSLNDSISRLVRLNKNLLLLSKINHNIFNETTQLSINELIQNQLDFFTEQAHQKNIQIEKRGDIDVKVIANTGLTEILLRNLLLNAIQHNVQNGRIYIRFTENKLTIVNTGTHKALSQEKLFSRFSKTHASKQGNGLGLAIVKKIADLNHWMVSYTFSNNLHFFSVQFQ